MARIFGWISLPLDAFPAPALEELPRLICLGVPVLTAGWMLFAAGVKRCRDADFPVPLLIALIVLCILAACARDLLPYPLHVLRQFLRTFLAFTEILLLMLAGALALFDNLSLRDAPTAHLAERAYRLTTGAMKKTPRFGKRN